ncbi:MAG: MBL fold metallo-hydrolase [Myxococcales bacterium]|nr:MBL fold metallo-hydrolase [Myxococcales bacterium]
MHKLYDRDGHQNLFFHDLCEGAAVQANQHVIVDHGEAMLLDPGGHKVYTKLFAELASLVPPSGLKHLFFSHQDPDIVAAANGWLMVTEATAHVSKLWTRFIPHFGIDAFAVDRMIGIEDGGGKLAVGSGQVKFLPAHFLHSSGNIQVYDCVSKILYSGDLGAAVGPEYAFVEDFEAHARHMRGFHQRYMPTSRAIRAWARMVRGLDIETIAPQHGAMFVGKEMVGRFIDWVESLECGIELLEELYQVPD